jgi:hypothetical protein
MTTHADAHPVIGVRVWSAFVAVADVFRSLRPLTRQAEAWTNADLLNRLTYRDAPLSDQLERHLLLRTIGNV